MRFSLVLALALAFLTVTASAEKYQKPKAKPSYSAEKESKGSAHGVRPPSNRNSASQELHKVEQSSAKTSGARHDSSKTLRTEAVLRAEKQERNPPINASSARGGGQGGKGKQSASSYKGRLRHKGSHR